MKVVCWLVLASGTPNMDFWVQALLKCILLKTFIKIYQLHFPQQNLPHQEVILKTEFV